MRNLSQEEIQSVSGGAYSYKCTSFLWYLLTDLICCNGVCYEY